MKLEDLVFFSLSPDIDCSSFDCNDEGINVFIHSEAVDYQSHNLGKSYGFKTDKGEVIAYFTIFNDCIRDLGDTKKKMEKFGKSVGLPHPKRLVVKSYPAIKIGRLGICKSLQGVKREDGSRFSDDFMKFIKAWTIKNHKPAVKFLILDSYNNDRNKAFYLRNGFEYLPVETTPEDLTVPMYFHVDKIVG